MVWTLKLAVNRHHQHDAGLDPAAKRQKPHCNSAAMAGTMMAFMILLSSD
jgi:hypothetical protein